MKVTMQVRLLPSGAAAAALKNTVEAFNKSAAWLAVVVEQKKIPARAVAKFAVTELGTRFSLCPSLAERCAALILRERKRANARQIGFPRRLHDSVPLLHDQVDLLWWDRVSVFTNNGPRKMPFAVLGYQLTRFDCTAQQCDLSYRPEPAGDTWSLLFTTDLPDGTVLPLV